MVYDIVVKVVNIVPREPWCGQLGLDLLATCNIMSYSTDF